MYARDSQEAVRWRREVWQAGSLEGVEGKEYGEFFGERRLLFRRARNDRSPFLLQVERNEMVFALNQVIERLAEGEKEREDRLREFPWLKSTS